MNVKCPSLRHEVRLASIRCIHPYARDVVDELLRPEHHVELLGIRRVNAAMHRHLCGVSVDLISISSTIFGGQLLGMPLS